MRTLVIFGLLGALLCVSPALAQAPAPGGCSCSADARTTLDPSVVWQGTERLTLADIAALAAPVLWFSADEPLLETADPTIPAVHPCDAPAHGPVVYQQAVRIAYRGAEPVTTPVDDDPALMDKVAGLVFRFFFYYPEDAGVGGTRTTSRVSRWRCSWGATHRAATFG